MVNGRTANRHKMTYHGLSKLPLWAGQRSTVKSALVCIFTSGVRELVSEPLRAETLLPTLKSIGPLIAALETLVGSAAIKCTPFVWIWVITLRAFLLCVHQGLLLLSGGSSNGMRMAPAAPAAITLISPEIIAAPVIMAKKMAPT